MINTFLFVAGINTLLQTYFGTRLPVVMGASYAFIIPIISISFSRRFSVYTDPHQVGFYILFLPVPYQCIQNLADSKRKCLEMLVSLDHEKKQVATYIIFAMYFVR